MIVAEIISRLAKYLTVQTNTSFLQVEVVINVAQSRTETTAYATHRPGNPRPLNIFSNPSLRRSCQ
jgi:hypothetical protein